MKLISHTYKKYMLPSKPDLLEPVQIYAHIER